MNRRGFTLIEILITLVIVSIGLVAIIEGVRYSLTMLSRTQSDVVAINLAREGVESVYNIRNTNWLRWSGEKDANWLNINPMETNDKKKEWMQKDTNYILAYGNDYWSLVPNDAKFDDGNGGYTYDKAYRLCKNNGFYGPCGDDLEGVTPYFRVIRGEGLYQKDEGGNSNKFEECINGNKKGKIGSDGSVPCDSDRPKEFRFCSKVVTETGIPISVEFCGLMTNFEK